MRRLGKRIVAITLAATMMGSLTPQAMTFLQNEVVYAAETSGVVYESDTSITTNVKFGDTEVWNNPSELVCFSQENSEYKVGEKYSVEAKISINEKDFNTLRTDGYFKLKSYAKNKDWAWKDGSITELKPTDFSLENGKYVASIKTTFSADEEAELWAVGFQLVGTKFEGDITCEHVKIENEETPAAVTRKEIYNSKQQQIATGIDFSTFTKEEWGDGKKVILTYDSAINSLQLTEDYELAAKVTLSEDAYNTLTEGKYIKIQGVTKGDKSTWTDSQDCKELKQDAFTKNEDADTYSADITISFAGKAVDTLKEIDFVVVGVGFKGNVTFSNVAVTNLTSEKPTLDKQKPTVLSDLSTEADFEKWNSEGGWDYTHGGDTVTGPEISYDKDNQRLKVDVDYSKNATETWSEAKVKYTATKAVSIKNYNQVSVDLIYPINKMPDTQMKFYAKDSETDKNEIINVYGDVDISNAKDLGNGYQQVTVSMNITPTDSSVKELTVSIVGNKTDYKGAIYLDNLTLSQKDTSKDFVEITSKAGNGTTAKITTPDSIKITDSSADKSAKALYAYLQGLTANEQVLFGHQNDVNKSVNASASNGDVYDITGSVSGVFGIDSLGVVGTEAGGTSSEDALQKAVAASKKAAENGAIVTLSTHMPNFAADSLDGDEIKKNDNGSYDFYKCDFSESKVCTTNAIEEVLKEGSESNNKLNAYLDIIADYAKKLQNDNIPVIFRPYHENTGTWFWWGAQNSAESYKSLYRYTKDYLENKGVHNMLYVYSPNGPLESKDEYMSRYPGDEYVDILAFDYYDDYSSTSEAYDDSYFTSLNKTCQIVSELASEKGKLSAISECGVRVTRQGSSEGLAIKDNPIKGQNWYQKVSDVAKNNNMPYYLVWANFGDTNFYVPYKTDDTHGQELINEFIDYYNDDSSVFGKGTGFKDYVSKFDNTNCKTETYDEAKGYMVSPFDMAEITEPTKLKAVVKNADSVSFVVKGEKTVTLDATKGSADSYSATLTADAIKEAGGEAGVDTATITLVAKKGNKTTEFSTIKNISIGKKKPVAPANVLEDFDYYSGSDDLVSASYTGNSAGGCSSSFKLDTTNKKDGTYGGAFNYKLKTTGSEVWTGQVKALANTDFSAYNALKFWVKLDGKGQKVVVQLQAGNDDYEVFLNNLSTTTGSYELTIPFSSFKGKNGGTLNPNSITALGIWCNSIGAVDVNSTIYFDGIQAVNATGTTTKVENGFVIADANSGNNGGSTGGSTGGTTTPGTTTPDKPSSDTKTETSTETKPDGTKIETTTTTKEDGSVTKKSEITDASGKKTATVTVKTDAAGKTTASASVISMTKSGAKTTISADAVKKITEAAGTKDVEVSQKVVDAKGKTLYTVKADASDLKAGKKLTLVKYNEKTKQYTLVTKKDYKVSKSGNVNVSIKDKGTYKLVDQKEANVITKNILSTVKAENKTKNVKKDQKTTMALSSELDMTNVSKITYSSSKKSVAKVDKNGKVTAKKAGTATIKAKVTLKNGKTKTVTMKVTVK